MNYLIYSFRGGSERICKYFDVVRFLKNIKSGMMSACHNGRHILFFIGTYFFPLGCQS